MKVLVTGANGMLGKDVVDVLGEKHQLILTGRDNLDITNYQQSKDFINQHQPEIIINCAAYTLVDKCEIELDLAFKVNALGPRNLAVICNDLNIPLLHISTDYVFDGSKSGSYLEDDSKNPLSIYGKSKSLGEDYIVSLTNKFYIIRTSWLFGYHGNNFIKTMLQLGKSKTNLTVVNDQFGSPTYTKDLAKAIALLIEEPKYGIYHITNCEFTNWYEFAKLIFQSAGMKVTIQPISTEEFNRPAPRPKCSVLENRVWRLGGFPPLRRYQEAVSEYIEEYLGEEQKI